MIWPSFLIGIGGICANFVEICEFGNISEINVNRVNVCIMHV